MADEQINQNEETTVDETPVETTEETTEVETKDKEPAYDERTRRALELLDTLEDPSKGHLLVKNLAKQAGLFEAETPGEARRAERKIKDIVKAKLGDAGSFISDELGETLEELFEDQIGKIRREMEERDLMRVQKERAAEYADFVQKNSLTDKDAEGMMKIMEDLPWNEKGSMSRYLDKILRLHRAEEIEAKSKAEKNKKIENNFKARPSGSSTEVNDSRLSTSSKGPISVEEAVKMAMRGERIPD